MSNFHYHILKTAKALATRTDAIEAICNETLQKATSVTEHIEVDIVVRYSPAQAIPELGISGQYTKEAHCIDIFIDLENLHLRDNLETEMKRTVIHEYMHVLREEYVSWEDGTLLDSLIAEGLAQSFELEIEPMLSPSIYSSVLTEAELNSARNDVKKHLNDCSTIIDEWLFGSDSIKRWSGYSLGFSMVQDKIKKSGLPTSELYKLPSKEFLL